MEALTGLVGLISRVALATHSIHSLISAGSFIEPFYAMLRAVRG
jgi:hypothetical protein